MEAKFVVRAKNPEKKEEKSVITTLRMDRKLQEEYDLLAKRSGYSRNELMCMALCYALERLEFVSEEVAEGGIKEDTAAEE